MKFFPNIRKTWKDTNILIKEAALLLTIAIILILSFPILFTQSSLIGIEFGKNGEIGDTIGGILGPFIAIIAAILTFAAFFVQYQANQIQIKNFQNQQDITNVQQFESKFYEMIKLHKNNVSNIIRTSENKNKDYFIEAFDDLRILYFHINHLVWNKKQADKNYDFGFESDDTKCIFQIAYLIYWFGPKYHSDDELNTSLIKFCSQVFIKYLNDDFIKIEKHFRKGNSNFKLDIFNKGTFLTYKIYTDLPFKEHASTLGHYYRNLYQTVKYVDDFDSNILCERRKYNYEKLLEHNYPIMNRFCFTITQ